MAKRKLFRRKNTEELCLKTTIEVYITMEEMVECLAYEIYLKDEDVSIVKKLGRQGVINLAKSATMTHGASHYWDFADTEFKENHGVGDIEENQERWDTWEAAARERCEELFPELVEDK